jgi:RNA polymerase I-specific transcription initiation factor RRN3
VNRYNELIEILTRDPSNPEAPSTLKLHIWITVLTQSVSLLDKSSTGLVEAILQIDWSFRSQNFVTMYIHFLKNLVSAHAFYIVPVLNSLVQGFRYRMFLLNNNHLFSSTNYFVCRLYTPSFSLCNPYWFI